MQQRLHRVLSSYTFSSSALAQLGGEDSEGEEEGQLGWQAQRPGSAASNGSAASGRGHGPQPLEKVPS